MRPEQLSDRIGNVDDRLIQQAEHVPNYGRRRRARRLRHMAAAAAVLALMLASFTTGALVFAKETVVEVPAKQETIELPELGMTLIVPDSWKGRYEVVQGVFEPYDSPMWTVCVKSIYDAGETDEYGTPYQGMLFVVFQYENRPMSEKEFEESGIAGIGRYLFATENATYAIMYATDIQYDISTPEKAERYGAEYADLASEMKDIRIVIEHAFAD